MSRFGYYAHREYRARRRWFLVAAVLTILMLFPYPSSAGIAVILPNEAYTSGSSGLTGGVGGQGAAIMEAAKNLSFLLSALMSATTYATLSSETVFDTDNQNCRLTNATAIDHLMQNTARIANRAQEEGMVGLINNPRTTPMRAAMSHLYRLCQNGQLTPQDFGQRWFAENRCLNNPSTAHDFLKASTILDSPVLVPPTQAQFDILLNPASHPQATVASTFNALNDKQRKYMGAINYCLNLIIGHIFNGPKDNAALLPENMYTAAVNRLGNGMLTSTGSACTRAIAQREGREVSSLGAQAEERARKQVNLLVESGYDPRQLYVYADDTALANNTPIGGGTPVIHINEVVGRLAQRAHALSLECRGYADKGTQAAKTTSHLRCAEMAQDMRLQELNERRDFLLAALRASVPVITDVPAPASAVPANFLQTQENQVWQDTALERAIDRILPADLMPVAFVQDSRSIGLSP
jgi:hypothetical protein